jgi:hypothetical protein
MQCEVCDWEDFVAADYATEQGRAPALQCVRCGALNLHESAASNDAERAAVRLAALVRMGIVAEGGEPAGCYAVVVAGRRASMGREGGSFVIRFDDESIAPLRAPGLPGEVLALAEQYVREFAQRRMAVERSDDDDEDADANLHHG